MKSVRAIRGLALTSLASLGLIAMTPAFAESDFAIGATPSVDARVDFEVIIPRYISFRVGQTGVNNIDLVQFDVTDPTSGTAVARSNGGALTVALLGNVGDIQIDAATTLLEDTVSSDTLSWAEIDTTSADAGLPAPVLVDGAITPVTVLPTAGRIVNRSTTWSYQYANSALAGAGTYEGRVTYTASAP